MSTPLSGMYADYDGIDPPQNPLVGNYPNWGGGLTAGYTSLYPILPQEEALVTDGRFSSINDIDITIPWGWITRYGAIVGNTVDAAQAVANYNAINASTALSGLYSGPNAFIPPGQFNYDGELEYWTNTVLRGSGMELSYLNQVNSAAGVSGIKADKTQGRLRSVVMSDFTLSDFFASGGGGKALYGWQTSYSLFQRIKVIGYEQGIRIRGPEGGGEKFAMQNRIRDCLLQACSQTGVYLGDYDNINDHQQIVDGCVFDGCSTAIEVRNMRSCTVSNNMIKSGTSESTSGIRVSSDGTYTMQNVSIMNNQFADMDDNGNGALVEIVNAQCENTYVVNNNMGGRLQLTAFIDNGTNTVDSNNTYG